jgi:putative transposase
VRSRGGASALACSIIPIAACSMPSAAYRAHLRRHHIRASMSRRANCWDNSVVESFFSSLKTELHPATWPTRAAARAPIADYIDGFYNVRRLHSTLGYRSPVDLEARFTIAV